MDEAEQAIDALFAGGDPAVRATYQRILAVLAEVGPLRVEPKKTSLHLVNGTGFAGVHPRKRSLTLNVRLDMAIQSTREVKTEQVSKHRYHNEIKLERPEDVDGEIVAWLRDAYTLAG